MNHASTRARWWLFDLQIPIGRNEEAEAHSQAGCAEYNAFVIRADCIVHFRRKYLKGLLSIPCDGRGARRPLGQSFRKSVGPTPVALSPFDCLKMRIDKIISIESRRSPLTIRRNVKHQTAALKNE